MGSGAQTVEETARFLAARGEKVGALTVRLYRPFSVADFVAALPRSVRSIAVLDRTKEPGAVGEPLYPRRRHGARGGEGLGRLDPLAARASADVTACLRRNSRRPWRRRSSTSSESPRPEAPFHRRDRRRRDASVAWPRARISTSKPPEVVRAVFFGLGADGTVGANKNTIKIIGEETDNHAQGYFVYDSKKSGAMTVSHLRFGPSPIRAPYLVTNARFVACHQFEFLERYDVLEPLEPGGDFLLNSPYGPEEIWEPPAARSPGRTRGEEAAVLRHRRVPGRPRGRHGRPHNTIMQTCFFEITNVLPGDEAIAADQGTRSRKPTRERAAKS